MLNDLKKYITYLSDNEEGKGTKNKIIFILLILSVLLLINKFFLIKFTDSENFQIHSALSNLLFFKGISPYSKDIASVLANYFSTRGVSFQTNSFIFQLPIYQLIFYLPFSLISENNWSLAIWLTVNQFLFLLCIENCFKILKWVPKYLLKIVLMGIGTITFFGISNFIAANTSIIQLLFLILGLKYLFSEKYVFSGLIIGLATIDPFNLFIPLGIVLGFLISRKQFEPLIWLIISIVLLSLTGLFFDSGWVLKMLKNIFLEGSFYPFIDYNHALLNWISILSSGKIISFAPFLLLIWIFMEYSRLPKQNSNQFFWLLSLVSCINPFVIMRETNYASVLYLLPLVFIVYLWECHSTGTINKVIYGILFLTAAAIPLVSLLFPGVFGFLANFHSINLINSIVLIMVLYWIRWWVVKPYDYLMTE
ncbi:MAG: hypothetical protein Q8N39_06495 [Pelolinea sp.]|nr:hypothetical protein [Pelolinea sp.]